VILNVTPVVSLAPGFAVAFGFTMTPRYLVTGIIVFFPLLVNSLVGLRAIDPEALQYFQTLDASRLEVLLHLRVPSSLPFLFAAARICFPLSVIGAVVSEFSTAGTANGLGSLIEAGFQYNYLPQIYAAIFCLSLLGLAFTLLVTLIERRALSWRPAGSGRV
jgi:NitT/TauT family transport system permease protein